MVTRRDMKAPITSTNGSFQGGFVQHVALDAFKLSSRQPARVGSGPQHRLHVMPARNQFVNEICADESRGASYKAFHVCNQQSQLDRMAGFIAGAFLTLYGPDKRKKRSRPDRLLPLKISARVVDTSNKPALDRRGRRRNDFFM